MAYCQDQMRCPACGGIATSESVDVGVGLYVMGDFTCRACGWEVDGPDDYGFIEMEEVEFAPAEVHQ